MWWIRRPIIVVALTVCCFASGAWSQEAESAAKSASEIGPSVQFGQADAQGFRLSDFRGKLVVVVYFQSWCGICNGWSPRLFSQLEQAAGDSQEVVLLAVKTDGGGYKGAVKYLKTRISDRSRWLIASDRNAAWYQVATGTNALYGYVVIGPDGTVLDRGKAGTFYTGGRNKDKFILAADIDKHVQQTKPATILPKGKSYQKLLKPAVRAVELRKFAVAWQLCRKASRKKADAAAELKKDLTDWADKRVKALAVVLADGDATGEAKFEAYTELKQIGKDLRSTDPGKEARKAAAVAAKDKSVAREIRAAKDYLALMTKSVKAKSLVKNRAFAKSLNALAKKHPDTRYGRMAAADAIRIAG